MSGSTPATGVSVVSNKSLYSNRHFGLDPECSLSALDSRSPLKACGDKLRGNDGLGNESGKRWYATRVA